MDESERDDEFWEIAADEIESGEEVTVVGKNGHVITCATLAELYQARDELEAEGAL